MGDETNPLPREVAVLTELLDSIRWVHVGNGQYRCAFCEMDRALDQHYDFCRYARVVEPDCRMVSARWYRVGG